MSKFTEMPFGKYKGLKLEEIPVDYLDWLIKRADKIDPDLKAAVEEEVTGRREKSSRRKQQEENEEKEREDKYRETVRNGFRARAGYNGRDSEISAAVGKWFRDMARKYHPDRGGTDAQMQVANQAHEMLLQVLRESGLI